MYLLAIELTNNCNKNCIWCGARAGLNQNLSYSDVISSIDKYKPRELAITGGEPLLREDLFQIIDYCKSKNIKVTLCTNGTLITEDIAKKLNADIINISIDGIETIHDSIRGSGSFAEVLDGLSNLKKANKLNKVVIATVLGQQNKDQANKIINFFYPEINKFMIARVVYAGKAKQKWLLNALDILKVYFSILPYRLNPFMKVVLTVQFWQLPGPAFMGPVIRADGKIGYCCVRYNKIIGDIKNTNSLRSTTCMFCKGCSKYKVKDPSKE